MDEQERTVIDRYLCTHDEIILKTDPVARSRAMKLAKERTTDEIIHYITEQQYAITRAISQRESPREAILRQRDGLAAMVIRQTLVGFR